MLRQASILLLVLAACGDLTNVPEPPVALSALDADAASAPGGTVPTIRHRSVRVIQMVPPGALATLHIPDMQGTSVRFQQTSAAKLLSSPEFKQMMGPAAAMFAGASGSFTGAPPGMDVSKITNALKGDLVICLEDVVIPQDGGEPSPRVLVAADIVGATDEFNQLLEFVSLAAASSRGVRVEKGTAASTPFTRIVISEPKKMEIEFAMHRDVLMIGIGRETVTAAIERVSGGGASIEDQDSYKTAMTRLGDPRDAFRLYLDVGRAYRSFGHYLPKEARRVLGVLGLGKIRGVAVAARLEGPDITVSALIDSPGGEDILTRILSKNSVDPRLLEKVPEGASSFSLFAVDGQALLDELRKVLPAKDRAELEQSLQEAKDDGVDIEKDILGVFGPRLSVIQTDTGTGAGEGMEAVWNYLRGTAAIIEVREPVRAIKTLARLPETDAIATRRSHSVQGHKAVTYRFDSPELPQDLSISYALADDYLYVALSVEALQKVLAAREGGDVSRYDDLMKMLPGPVAALSYDEPAKGTTLPLGLLGVSTLRPGGGNSAPPEPNTALARLMRGFNPTVSYVVADNQGVLSVTRSPTAGIGSMGGVTGLFMLASIAIPSMAAARVGANETAALSALETIRTAQQTYHGRAYSDGDRDGEGSYGFLSELTGDYQPEGGTKLATPLLRPGYLKKTKHGWERNGYLFRVYLPAEDGSPIGGHEAKERLEVVDRDLAETVMVFVAWPVHKGRSGERAFLLNAQGDLFSCSKGDYEGANAPRADALSSQRNNIASAPRRFDQRTQDGYHWRKLR